MEIKKAQLSLLFRFWFDLAICAALAIAYENEFLLPGSMAGETTLEFILQTVMIFVTIGVIPLALRLFRFKKIRNGLLSPDGAQKLLLWGMLRIGMLSLPLLLNTLLYYLFMRPGFGYLAIILLLTLFFVYPSKRRCIDETNGSNSQL